MRNFILKGATPLLITLVLAGCANEHVKTEEKTSGQTISTTQTPPTSANTNPIPPPSGGNPSTTGCNGKTNITGPILEWPLQGYKGETKDTPLNGIVSVDSLIKVQIVPDSAIVSSDGSAMKNYTQLSADVTLLRNGTPVHTTPVTFPGTVDGNGYKNGIAINQGNTKDLSTLITQNGSYSIRISNVQTNHMCNTYCTAAQYSIYVNTDYYTCMRWASFGYSWTAYGCYGPDYTMINQCKQMKCNVGELHPTAGWKLKVRVETDTTQCL